MAQCAVTFDTSHQTAINDVSLDYYGKYLATAADHCVRLWDVSSEPPQFISELTGHEGPVWKVSWAHPRFGNVIATCSYDRKVIIWREQQSAGWQIVYSNDDHTSSVNNVDFSPWEFGLNLACGSSDGTVSIISYHEDTEMWSKKAFVAHPNGVLSVSWAPAGTSPSASNVSPGGSGFGTRQLVTGGCDNQVRVWRYIPNTNEWIEVFQMTDPRHRGWVLDVAWRPNVGLSSNVVASCSEDKSLVIWAESENSPWKAKQIIELGDVVSRLSWSVTGTVLAASLSGSNQVALFKENLMGQWERVTNDAEEERRDGEMQEAQQLLQQQKLQQLQQLQTDELLLQQQQQENPQQFQTNHIQPQQHHQPQQPQTSPPQFQQPPPQFRQPPQQFQQPPQQFQQPPQQFQQPPQQFQQPPQQFQQPPQQFQHPPPQFQQPPQQQFQQPPQQQFRMW